MNHEHLLWAAVVAIVALAAVFVITHDRHDTGGPVLDPHPVCVIVLPDSPDPRPIDCSP